jgi:2-oxo-4-hydroxy-4-carboxy--5-ureidoimidazoline (OHCU) decarboxylase
MPDHLTITTMARRGGSFVKALAEAWRMADDENRARLEAAFPEVWAKYAAIAQELAARSLERCT